MDTKLISFHTHFPQFFFFYICAISYIGNVVSNGTTCTRTQRLLLPVVLLHNGSHPPDLHTHTAIYFFACVCVSARLVLPCTCSRPKIAQCHIWLPSYAPLMGTRPLLVTLEAGQPLHIARTGHRAPHLSAAVVQRSTTFFSAPLVSLSPGEPPCLKSRCQVSGGPDLHWRRDTGVTLELNTRLLHRVSTDRAFSAASVHVKIQKGWL